MKVHDSEIRGGPWQTSIAWSANENNADHAVPWENIKDWIAAGFILLIIVCVAAVVRKKRASGSYRR
ncbi:hypothetical protein [Paenibacillus sp. JZ16]|uniref:hypothetical protein n=1 Tax=Paenibacillus sp. JZ16 TaxID=1906272 RepID=UPI00188AA404|nr:hypothetical protein [Paenibacillus sp. JZ16]